MKKLIAMMAVLLLLAGCGTSRQSGDADSTEIPLPEIPSMTEAITPEEPSAAEEEIVEEAAEEKDEEVHVIGSMFDYKSK